MLGVLAAVALTLGLVGAPAGAASLTAQPTAVTEGGRVVITIKGKKPTKATLIVGGTRYQLKRKGKVWRTKPLSAEALAGMSGAKAKVKVRVKGKNKTLKTSIQGTGTNPTTPGGGTQPPFAAPGVDREGECQGTLVSARWRTGSLPGGGHEFCPVMAMGSARWGHHGRVG